MDAIDHLAQLRRDGTRIAELARGNLGAPVPTCPGWTLADLVEHTGFVHRWQTAAVRDAPTTFPDESTWRHGPDSGESPADWFARGVDDAVAVMGSADPDAQRWTWAGPNTVRWYLRRIAQETLVHRIDAELAAGVAIDDVDPRFAVDGVEEMCAVFLPASVGDPIGGSGQTLHLHATDTEGEWLFTLLADRVESEHGHRKGDAAVQGRAVDLLMMTWGREPLAEVTTFGDPAVITLFNAAAKL